MEEIDLQLITQNINGKFNSEKINSPMREKIKQW